MNKKFYITTPLYYVNDILHIGHAYCTVAVDVLARFRRLKGEEVFFLTGTDEHGQKIEQAARLKGEEPQAWIESIVKEDKKLWKRLNISYDDFIQTTQVRHKDTVQAVFTKLYEKGDIYKGKYEGWYCVPCETFCLEGQLVEGKCPECGRIAERVAEESYFFKLSEYQEKLLDYFNKNPYFMQPPSRQAEMINFVKSGLKDLSVSRLGTKWGIPVPFDSKHTIYVWFDALINYITAVDYLKEGEKFKKFWPADIHLVGKEIFKFHVIIWPAMLMALDIEIPRKVFGHGWWTVEGEKMSKSKGNVVNPHQVVDEFGVDAFRYFLLREVPFGLDGDFSRDSFINRYNADLANDLGNLLNRTLVMLEKYFEGIIPIPESKEKIDDDLINLIQKLPSNLEVSLERLEFHSAFSYIWEIVNFANKYIDEMAPWKLFKENKERLQTVIYNLMEVLRIVSLAIVPFMPETSEKMEKQLGISHQKSFGAMVWGGIKPGNKIEMKGREPLFPRIIKPKK